MSDSEVAHLIMKSVVENNRPMPVMCSRIGWFHKGRLYNERDWVGLQNDRPLDVEVVNDYAVVASAGGKKLLLSSDFLRELYLEVVDSFPGVSIDDAGIRLDAPYVPLFFGLEAMQKQVEGRDLGQDARLDFAALQDFYQRFIRPSHERIQAVLAGGSVMFEDIWALFRPGDLLFAKDEFDQPQLCCIAHSTYREGISEEGDDDSAQFLKSGPLGAMFGGNLPKRFCFDAWSTRWDGSTRTFSRSLQTFRINSFRGSRSITSLQYYPLQYHNTLSTDADREQFLQKLEARGNLWKELISGTPVCRFYRGPAISLEKGTFGMTRSDPTNLNDRVIVDHDGAFHHQDPQPNSISIPPMGDVMKPLFGLLQMFNIRKEQPVQAGEYDESYTSFDDFPADSAFDPLQARLSPSSLNCFSLTTRKWFAITIENLKDVEWSTSSLEHLVAPENVKDMIIKLVQQHRNQEREGVVGDVIHGKGNGLVIVLHGPPGVGKTLTAESVAEFTQRPLYSINVGEVTSEQQVRGRLQQIFTEATRWNAVLLLDEADVVLEKRSFEDIRRNGTVSIFLRMLEYYEGILFLTTNRLRHIDDAFQSRIHLAFQYQALTIPSRRQIWANFINRLPDCETPGKTELLQNLDELEVKTLNGRQIRNVMFIAQSLAKSESANPGGLRFRHVEDALQQTATFQSYFEADSAGARGAIGAVANGSRNWQEEEI